MITVWTGGLARWAVAPRAPAEASIRGANGNAAQPAGVKVLARVERAGGSPYEVASTVVVAGAQEVGLRMNGRPPAVGRPARVNAIRSV